VLVLITWEDQSISLEEEGELPQPHVIVPFHQDWL